MKEGPDIARLGALIGDPARANMLTALMSGKALTASELASEAGITAPTASGHLSKLQTGGLVRQRKQGRHRYFSLADHDVGRLLETMMGLAAKQGHLRLRTGPKDPELRKARICYNHLAGDLAVRMLDNCIGRGLILVDCDELALTPDGQEFFTAFGLDLAAIASARRPVCIACLDWSARRNHLAGGLGTALLNRYYDLGWAKRDPNSRAIRFTRRGEAAFLERFGD